MRLLASNRQLAVPDRHAIVRQRKKTAVRCAAHHEPSRRELLNACIAASWVAASLAPSPSAAASVPSSSTTIQVPQDAATIAEALALASDGDTVLLAAGIYRERAIITRAVTLAAAPGAAVEISHSTSSPYESTIVIDSDGVVLRDISIRHNSPSIANNYAVQATAACGVTTRLERCDVSSASGSGVGVEGGALNFIECRIYDCVRSGVAVFSDFEGAPGRPTLERCRIDGNKAHGVLVRDGAEPNVLECVVEGNGGYGLALQGCGGVYKGNAVRGNRAGAVAVNLLAEGLDADVIAADNGLDRRDVAEVALKSAV